MFAFEQGWSADIPATLNTGSPSFGASLGLPVSKTSWHCCGFQANTVSWPQNKEKGGPLWAFQKAGRLRQRPRGSLKDSLSTAPQTRAMPHARRARVASPQLCRWLQSRTQEVSLSLGQQSPVSCGCRLPGPRPPAAASWAA